MVATLYLLLVAQDFAGSKACAACHAEIVQKQQSTHHARALQRGADGRWAFGAGAQAITYVSPVDEDHYLEHGLSWYRRIQALALTPGHTNASGVRYPTFSPDANLLRCFQCHSTGQLTLTPQRTVQPAEEGVRCETCHGSGRAHAAAPSPANIRNPRRLTAAQINETCGECHRMPPAKGVATNFENPWNVRHQPVYFSQSACFQKSGGGLSCLTCHNPHDDKPADAQCASCHPQAKHSTPVSGTCVSCHMPVVKPSDLLGFANHWIGVYRLTGPGANLLRPRAQGGRR